MAAGTQYRAWLRQTYSYSPSRTLGHWDRVRDRGSAYALTQINRLGNTTPPLNTMPRSVHAAFDAIFAQLFFDPAPGGGGQSAVAGLVLESSTVFALGRLKTRSVGLVAETDTPFAASRRKSRTAGLATSASTVFGVTKSKAYGAGLVTSLNTALAVTRSKIKAVGLVVSSGAALAVSAVRQKVVGLVTSASTVFGVGRVKSRTVGIVQEIDSALPVGGGIVVPPGPVLSFPLLRALWRRLYRRADERSRKPLWNMDEDP